MSQLQVTGEAKIRDIQGPVVANSGVITALDGAASQYVRGDGTLADFPTSTGGGSSVSYYLNGSINQGTFGGSTYYEMSKTPIIGAGTDFPVSTNGLVSQFITDANDPDLLEVPGGNFNLEFYFSVNNNTGNPTVYAELYKYDGATFTLLGSSQAIPESINQGTTIAPYYFAIPVGTAALNNTDRIAIRIYANVDGRTVTLHTENSHLCQVVTTFSKGMVSLNNLTDQNQYLATGTSGTNFAIVSSGDTHTFNLPVASATNTGKLSSTDWSTFNNKVPYTGANNSVDLGAYSLSADTINGVGIFSVGSGTQSGFIGIKQGTTFLGNISGYNSINANATKFILTSDVGSTNYKSASFQLGSLTNNTERTYTLPDLSGTLALLEGSQTFTGVKTFTQNLTLDGNGSNAGTLLLKSNSTLPTAIGYTGINSTSNSIYLTTFVSNPKTAAFDLSGLSDNIIRTFTFPNSSGTIALTSDLGAYVPYTGATANVDLGGFSLYFNNGQAIFGKNFAGSTAYALIGLNPSNKVSIDTSALGVVFGGTIGNGTYTYTLPSATGTLALTSNLSAYVPYTGATGAVNLGTNELTSGNAKINDTLYLKVATTYAHVSGYYGIQVGTNLFTINNSASTQAAFSLASLTTSRTFTLPDSNGTLALTSNLSAYLPLSGGTLTGALSGTSATFSGTVLTTDGFQGRYFRIFEASAQRGGFYTYNVISGAGTDYSVGLFSESTLWFAAGGGITKHLQIGSTGAATFSGSVGIGITPSLPLYVKQVSSDGYAFGIESSADDTKLVIGKRASGFAISATYGSTGSYQPLSLYTSDTPRLTIATNGAATFSSSVFIGSSITSAATLHVNNALSADPTSLSSVPTTNVFGMSTSPGAMLAAGIGTSGGSHVWLQGRNTGGAGVSYPIILQPLGGNVGIGTSSFPSFSGSQQMTMKGGSSNTNSVFQVQSFDAGTSLTIYSGAGASDDPAIIFQKNLRFGSTTDTGLGGYTERMRITSVGEVLYGTSTTPYNSALFRATYGTNNYFSYGPRNNDTTWVVWNNGGTGVYLSNGNTSWTGVSDERLKDIKSNIENACDIIKDWRSVVFSWKNEDNNNLNVGLIAQDVEKTLPQIIDKNKLKEDEFEYLGVRYSEVVPVLVKCIQELQARIVTLESKIS